MGMDLIGIGYTIDPRKDTIQMDAVKEFVAALPEIDDNDPISWDPSGIISDTDDWRWMLERGAKEYLDTADASRLVIDFEIGRTGNTFVFTGGGSWGDDPFDGYTYLCLFTNLLDENEELRALTNYVGGGIVVDDNTALRAVARSAIGLLSNNDLKDEALDVAIDAAIAAFSSLDAALPKEGSDD
jgi:hypothetical protein